MNKIKVTAVSYLNTKPFLYGIFKTHFEEKIDLQLDIPSVCARKLKEGSVDLGLVPVAVIPELPAPHIVSDYCIGAQDAVKTVGIFSECPIENITHLYLDYHSRTSVELVKLLLRDFWGLNPILLPVKPGTVPEITHTKAALLIGDKTIGLENQYPYFYDLATAWHSHTGLPFVFAAWVSNKKLPPPFINELNKALEEGLRHIPQLMYLLPPSYPDFDIKAYFTHHISYRLDKDKKRALSRFLQSISNEIQPTLELSLSV